MTKRNALRIVLPSLLVAACVTAVAFFLVSRLLDPEFYRARILAMAEKALDRRVSFTDATFSWNPAPSLVFRGILVREKNGSGAFLSVDRLTVSPALLPLLRREFQLRSIVLESPRIRIARDRSGTLSISDLLSPGPAASRLRIGSVRIRKGFVRFEDRMAGPNGLDTSLEELDLFLSDTEPGERADYSLSTALSGGGARARITMSGRVRIPPKGQPLQALWTDTAFSIQRLDAGRYRPYYEPHIPIERIGGSLDFEGAFTGSPGDFVSRGKVRVTGFRLSWPQVFRQPLTSREFRLAYDLKLTPRDLSVPTLDLSLDGLRVKGNCTVRDLRTRDPEITARASTSPFRLGDVRGYIPLDIIPRDTADFIERRIAGGVYRLDQGSLKGRVSRIARMGRNRNNDVLMIRGRVEGGIVRWGAGIPAFSRIAGELELNDRDFILRRMSGSFGDSPFTLEGKIAGYSLAGPSSYPFTLEMTPGMAEVAWLMRQEGGDTLSFRGVSRLRLSGSGASADYRLSGDWDLTGAEYSYPELVRKQAGLENRIEFGLRLSESEAQLTALHYSLPSLELRGEALYPYDGSKPLSFSLATNRFSVDESFPILPGLRKFRPQGILQVSADGTAGPARSDAVHWKGEATLSGLSLRPSPRFGEVTNARGTVRFHDTSLESDRITATVGNTQLSVKGRLSGFSRPAGTLAFSSPALHLKDLGYGTPGEDPVIRKLAGDLSFQEGNLSVPSLSGQFGSSPFTLTGVIRNLSEPVIAVQAHFSFLRVEDLVTLGSLSPAGGAMAAPVPSPVVTATVTSDAGSLGDVPFAGLKADLSLERKRLLVKALQADIFGGAVSGSGEADFASAGGPHYRVRYHLDRVDGAQLVRTAGAKQEILAGVVTAEGDLSASGNNGDGLKKSARGTAKLDIRNGAVATASSKEGGAGHTLPFDRLRSELSFGNSRVEVGPTRIELFGGSASGQGTIDFTLADGPGYRITGTAEGIDADRLMHALGVGKEISGRLELKGELAAGGSSFADLKKAARGTIDLHLTKGTINKYATLAKVFSILNVSNLLKLQLPDMVGSGLPYHSIDGTFGFTDGIVESKDLYVNSPAVNMMIVGTADIVNEELDLTLGVQPLQTVGRVVSRIPVVGWILTGGDRSLLVTYFRAKGKWGDPRVTPIPVQSLVNGVFGIFKRTFNLPDKLVTDTGEVLMGR